MPCQLDCLPNAMSGIGSPEPVLVACQHDGMRVWYAHYVGNGVDICTSIL